MYKSIKQKLMGVGSVGFMSVLFAMLVLVGCGGPETPQSKDKAKLRVIHASYNAPSVDIKIDGNVAIKVLAYGKTSGYAEVNAGKRAVAILESGKTEPVLLGADLELAKDMRYTVIALNDAAKLEVIALQDKAAVNAEKAVVRFIHAAPDAPAVDIRVGSGDGQAVFSNRAFKSVSDYTAVDEGDYEFVVTAAGKTDAVVGFEAVKLEKGKVYTILASGTLDDKDQYAFVVQAFIDNDKGDASVTLKAKQPIVKGKSMLRVIHASFDGPEVDVSVDGTKAISGLAYGKSSGYAEVTEGKRAIRVTAKGSDKALIEAEPELEKDASYTVFAVNEAAKIEPILVKDARSVDANKAKVRFVHAAPDAPAVDIRVGRGDGQAIFSNRAFKSVSDYIAVDPGDYTLVVTAAGSTDALFTFKPVKLQAGQVLTVVAHGTLDDKDQYDLGVRVFVDTDKGDASLDLELADPPKPKARVMAIHASPDAPGVDLLVNDVKVKEDLKFGENTDYLELDAGTYGLKLNATGTNNTALQGKATVESGKAYSVFAIDELQDIELLVLEDDLTPPASGKVHVRFVHLSPDAPAVDIAVKGGPVVFSNKKFKDYMPFTPVDAGTYSFEVRLAGQSTVVLQLDNIELKAGHIYTIYAKGFAAPAKTPALGAGLIINHSAK